MEPLNSLENGNIPQKRKCSCCQVAFCLLMLVLTIISALVSITFCLYHHKQPSRPCWAHGFYLCCDKDDCRTALVPDYNCSKDRIKETRPSNYQDPLRWELSIQNCNGFVQEESGQYLIIQQSGNYFIYAQVNRKSAMEEPFTLVLYKNRNITLNKAVGPKDGDGKGTVNFGRPFLLQKEDRLYCLVNSDLKHIVTGNQTYWGLYKM